MCESFGSKNEKETVTHEIVIVSNWFQIWLRIDLTDLGHISQGIEPIFSWFYFSIFGFGIHHCEYLIFTIFVILDNFTIYPTTTLYRVIEPNLPIKKEATNPRFSRPERGYENLSPNVTNRNQSSDICATRLEPHYFQGLHKAWRIHKFLHSKPIFVKRVRNFSISR